MEVKDDMLIFCKSGGILEHILSCIMANTGKGYRRSADSLIVIRAISKERWLNRCNFGVNQSFYKPTIPRNP